MCSSCLIFVTKPRTDGSQMEIMARCVCNLRLVDTWPTQSARWLWPCHSLIKVLKTFHITVIKKCSGTCSMKLCQPHISKCKMYLGEQRSRCGEEICLRSSRWPTPKAFSLAWSLGDHLGEEDEVKMLVMILLGRMITVLVMVLAVMMEGT